MDFLHLAEETNEKYVNDELLKSYCVLYIGCVYFYQKKYDVALPCFTESLEISRRNGYWTGFCENAMMVGQTYSLMGNFDEALKIFNEGIEIAKEKRIRRLLTTLYSALSETFENFQKYFAEALNYYEKFRTTRLEQISQINEKNLESIKFLNHLEDSQKESEILKEKNSEMFRINEQLIETDKEKNDFLGVVVHDLKNPLTNIILMAGNLKKNYEKLKPEKVTSSFEKIYLSSERMLEIIDNLLDINKIESGNITLNIQEIKLKELIQRILSEFEIYSNQKNIKISLNTTDDTMINSDEMVIKEILMNLISNALKYSYQDSEVNIDIFDTNGQAEIRISDKGLGIKEEEKQKVFQKFAKISNKPTAGENSTGLGLSIVKKLTELCGGRIDFESEFGKGTTFILNF
jgi:signal transduction histidine kinase